MADKQHESDETDESHQIWTIGWNTFGQQVSGSNDLVDKLTPINAIKSGIQVRDIQTGYSGSTYILLKDNQMIVMGNNEDGQLGLGLHLIVIIINYWLQCLTIDLFINTDVINVINDFTSLQYRFPKISTPIVITHFNIKSISHGIGSHHRLIITQKNRIYGCGENTNKQLAKVNASNKLSTWRQIQSFIHSKITIKHIASSSNITNFLSNNADIYVIGRSVDGGLGLGKNIKSVAVVTKIKINTKFISIACGHDHSVALDRTYRTYSWGFNTYKQTGHPITDKYNRSCIYKPTELTYFKKNNVQVKMIDCGRYHSIWLDDAGNVYCAGSNSRGQCGRGGRKHPCDLIHLKKNISLKSGKKIIIVDIKCGRNHNCIKTNNNKYYLFGDNTNNECLVNPDYDVIATPMMYDDTYFYEQNKQIIAIYPGFYETRIVTKDIHK